LEQDKKDGKYDDQAWSKENRWLAYCEEKERKEESEKKAKDQSMFKEYNELMMDKPVSFLHS
jgi:hypothetical protein